VDFVITTSRDHVDAIECKWNSEHFDPSGLKAFRAFYPEGNNYLVCPIETPGYTIRAAGTEVYVCNPSGWLQRAKEPTTFT
jgi:hypothetical protein